MSFDKVYVGCIRIMKEIVCIGFRLRLLLLETLVFLLGLDPPPDRQARSTLTRSITLSVGSHGILVRAKLQFVNI